MMSSLLEIKIHNILTDYDVPFAEEYEFPTLPEDFWYEDGRISMEFPLYKEPGELYPEEVIKLQIERVLTRLENKRIELAFDDSVINFISDKGYDPAMGARPIKRAIQTYVENTLAKEILSGDIKEGDKLTATVENDAIVYKKG